MKTCFKIIQQSIRLFRSKDELYVFNGYAGSDKDSQLKLKIINELAWHNLFAQNMFIRPESIEEASHIKPNFTIVSAPHFKANPDVDLVLILKHLLLFHLNIK